MSQPLAVDEQRLWLALLHTPGLGPRRLLRLLQALGSPAAIIEANMDRLRALGLDGELLANLLRNREADPPWRTLVENDLSWLERDALHLLSWGSPAYPPLLAQTATPPPLLFVRGDVALLQRPQLAVVGSRSPTPAGIEIAQMLARALAEAGLIITSGLALGIDGAAHRGALSVPAGQTIAVVGTGLDSCYPARHRQLCEQIAAQGAVVCEFPFGPPPRADHFPRRNRVIAGLALGVLVVEAGLGSGSLITARHALEAGREIFAVPGSILNPLSRGGHALLRDGARLVERAEDVLEELGLTLSGRAATAAGPGMAQPPGLLTPTERELLRCIDFESTSVDLLVERSGLAVPQLLGLLSQLELKGWIRAGLGGYLRDPALGADHWAQL